MKNKTSRAVLVVYVVCITAVAAWWMLSADTRIQVSASDAGGLIQIRNLPEGVVLPEGETLGDGEIGYHSPLLLELETAVLDRNAIQFIPTGERSTLTVRIIDKLGQSTRGQGKIVGVWQGPIGSIGIKTAASEPALIAPNGN